VSPTELADYLETARITGEVATPRENNLSHIRRFLAQEENFDFGVELTRDWDFDSVFALMVAECGLRPDPAFTEGVDTISTANCIAGLDRLRQIVAEVASDGGRILFATGHPGGLFPVHAGLAAWAQSLGADIVLPGSGTPVPGRGGWLIHMSRVWLWHHLAGQPHTHYPEPMAALLDALPALGQELPDLVVADHGWAGTAGSRGLRTVGFADCNDPALFVAGAQGQLELTIGLDDGVYPELYAPMTEYLTRP
jgi:hypothetical protein